jgi:hypothetical protein
MVLAKDTYVFGFVIANWFQLIGTIFLQVQCHMKYWGMFNETLSSLLLFILMLLYLSKFYFNLKNYDSRVYHVIV